LSFFVRKRYIGLVGTLCTTMTLKETERDPLLVKATLKGEDIDKFTAIKRKHGVMHDSEVIRICINNTYQKLEPNATEDTHA
jgi:hypothetical protein